MTFPPGPSATNTEIAESLGTILRYATEDFPRNRSHQGSLLQVLCCSDFLAALREGPSPNPRDPSRPHLATTRKHTKFFEEVWGAVDGRYRRFAAHMVAMYRHGAVHQMFPQPLAHAGRRLAWFLYDGARVEISFPTPDFTIWPRVGHMDLMASVLPGDDRELLPVSRTALIEDFAHVVRGFIAEIEADGATPIQELRSRILATFTELRKDAPVDRPWW